MRKRSQELSIHNAKASKPKGWDMAISEAEQKIAEHEGRIAKLRLAIEIFHDMKERGEPFMPPAAESAMEEKAA